MAKMDFKNRSVSVHDFAMVPRADIPRSSFRRQSAHKTTFDAGYLVPIFVDEVLPGDTFNLRMTAFCRMSTPIFPVMDNLTIDTFFFFVPNRLVWVHWQNFMGEQNNPGDSISFTVPQIVSPAGGYAINTVFDYFGLPTIGQVGGGNTFSHSALPLRCYNLIWDQWFRDENLQNATFLGTGLNGDGPDLSGSYVLLRRGKRHDYFTGCLPWTQKGGVAITLPLTGNALVKTSLTETVTGAQNPTFWRASDGTLPNSNQAISFQTNTPRGMGTASATAAIENGLPVYPTNLYADLSTVTAATINQLRQSFQIQKLLERDARGGTRYTEIVRSHFGVVSPDARLQRPEYLGGGSSPVQVGSVPQTSATGLTGGTTPQGSLASFATIVHHDNGFTQSFTEHGHIIGLAAVRADLSYGQGLRRMWSRSTRYDFYFPVFAMLGEQAVLNKEIFLDGSANDPNTFGYQERWAEYRYFPSMITSVFRVNATGTLSAWHLSINFAALPALNNTFIPDTPPIARVIAAGAAGTGQQFLADFFFDIKNARPMPMYSVPGLIDHF